MTKIQLNFSEEIIPNIKYINLESDEYQNNMSGLYETYKYIFENKINKYIFHGFHQNGFLIIIYDIYSIEWKSNIEGKEIIIIPIEWSLKQINGTNITKWVIDVKDNIEKDVIVLENRKNINKIIDYKKILDITNNKNCKVIIKNNDLINIKNEKNEKKEKNIYKLLKNHLYEYLDRRLKS